MSLGGTTLSNETWHWENQKTHKMGSRCKVIRDTTVGNAKQHCGESRIRIKWGDAVVSLSWNGKKNTGGTNKSHKTGWRSNVVRGYHNLQRKTTLGEQSIYIQRVWRSNVIRRYHNLKRRMALGEPLIRIRRGDAVMSVEHTTIPNGKQHWENGDSA